MRGRSLTIAGAIAAVALVVRAVLDWQSKSGAPGALLLVAAAIGVALLLRRRYPRE